MSITGSYWLTLACYIILLIMFWSMMFYYNRQLKSYRKANSSIWKAFLRTQEANMKLIEQKKNSKGDSKTDSSK